MNVSGPRDVFVYGSRSYAATVRDLAMECGWRVLGFIDDHAPPSAFVSTFDDVTAQHAGTSAGMLIGIGYRDLDARWRAWERVRAAGWDVPALIHPRAHVAPSAQIGEGCILMAGVVVDHRTQVKDACVLWPQACVNHDCLVGANTFLSPQVVICGNVRLGEHSFIGAQSVIVDGADLPSRTRLRMGSRYTRRAT